MTAAQPLVADLSPYAHTGKDGRYVLHMAVGGMNCAGCAFKIEKAINTGDAASARVNVTEKRLTLQWSGTPADGNALAARVRALGFALSPLDGDKGKTPDERKKLLHYLAVAGFASGNIMIFSLALWFTPAENMDGATRQLFHWFSGLLAMPAIAYAGQPFFRSAWRALRSKRGNMDVPIAVALTLASLLSLQQTIVHGHYVYFDSAAMLLFFLLVGRYLDARAREHTRDAASDLLALMQGEVTVIDPDSNPRRLPAASIAPGMVMLVAKGEKILADGTAASAALLDSSAITGESLPRSFAAGEPLYAGMVNLGEALRVTASKPQSASLMTDIAALMDKAAQSNARYVRLADRISGWYTPLVHALAALTFIGWWQFGGAPWQQAVMYAATVLIITCPCALALAVPVSQVVAVSALFRKGLLVKSSDAFERMATVDTVLLDKTGTLTTGELALKQMPENMTADEKSAFAALAAHSRHPLSQAMVGAMSAGTLPQVDDAQETTGQGMTGKINGMATRIGNAGFLCLKDDAQEDASTVFCQYGDGPVHRLQFIDNIHADALEAVTRLKKSCRVILLTGDRYAAAQATAGKLGIDVFHAAVDPRRKYEIIEAEKNQGHRVLMVGDGLNDAAALACATASMSPATAAGIAQNAADIVYQRQGVLSVAEALETAKRVQRVIRQNFGMALFYNVFAIPLAVAGFVTPLVAAAAMSSSSLLVIVNALRLRKEATWKS